MSDGAQPQSLGRHQVVVTEQSALLADLADISRQIEAHKTAIWLLERQRDEVRHRLIASGWKPPEVAS